MNGRIVGRRDLGVWRLGTFALLATFVATCFTFGVDSASAKLKQPACGKFQKQVKKSKGLKKRVAKQKLKQCKNDRLVYGQVKNSHFVGARADGVAIDDVYCANGSWQSDVTLGTTPNKTGWRITDAKVRNAKNYTAVIAGKVKGGFHVIAIKRKGSQWFGGWEYFGEMRDPGRVEKKSGRALCAKL